MIDAEHNIENKKLRVLFYNRTGKTVIDNRQEYIYWLEDYLIKLITIIKK